MTAVIQLFGVKKCHETRKAERWFKERQSKIQLIDLRTKGLSPGELKSIASALGGIENLIQKDGSRYAETGLTHAAPSSDRLQALLLADPLLLKTPIARCGRQATLGMAPEIWLLWL